LLGVCVRATAEGSKADQPKGGVGGGGPGGGGAGGGEGGTPGGLLGDSEGGGGAGGGGAGGGEGGTPGGLLDGSEGGGGAGGGGAGGGSAASGDPDPWETPEREDRFFLVCLQLEGQLVALASSEATGGVAPLCEALRSALGLSDLPQATKATLLARVEGGGD